MATKSFDSDTEAYWLRRANAKTEEEKLQIDLEWHLSQSTHIMYYSSYEPNATGWTFERYLKTRPQRQITLIMAGITPEKYWKYQLKGSI